jgi:hypothetical protein
MSTNAPGFSTSSRGEDETDRQNKESAHVSTDAEGIDDMTERRRLQPPPQSPGLEHSIAACLQGGDISADKLGELISETREAVAAASAAAEIARSRAFDPAVIDPRAARDMARSDHVAKRLRLALPQLQNKLQKLHDAAEYQQWVTEFDRIRLKHAAASRTLREAYQEFESKLVAALTEARKVDAEVGKVLRDKPRDNPFCNNDGKQLLAVECAARHLGSIDQAHSLMHMKIPVFAEPNKLAWPPPQIPLGVQVAASMAPPRGPALDWQSELVARDRQRHAEAQRVANYYANQAREKEERDNAAARAARQRNGSAP